MDKKGFFVGLGGVGTSQSNKVLTAVLKETQKPECLFVDSSDIKDVDIKFYNVHMEEKTDE